MRSRVRRQRLFVPGPLPGLNQLLAAKRSLRRGGADGYAHLKRRWEGEVWRAVYAYRVRPVKRPVVVRCLWLEPHRRRDPDNIRAAIKLVLDALVACEILPGDGWQWIRGLEDHFEVNASRPGVLVELEEIGE